MAVQQTLPRRYIDREKLANFWRTNDNFKGKPCGIIVSRPVNVDFQLALRDRFQVKADSYVIQVPRQMTEVSGENGTGHFQAV
jgi:hypothetical protein